MESKGTNNNLWYQMNQMPRLQAPSLGYKAITRSSNGMRLKQPPVKSYSFLQKTPVDSEEPVPLHTVPSTGPNP